MENKSGSEVFPQPVSSTVGAGVNATFHCAITIVRGSKAYPEAGRIVKGMRSSGAVLIVRADHIAAAAVVPRYLLMVAGRKRTLVVGREYNLHNGDPTRSVRIRIDAMERLT